MKYLLHHTDATYDANKKEWVFTLDRRIANPRSIRIETCTFTAATADTYPAVVYMRSRTLTSWCTIKHTIEVKGADHENHSNVLAVLEQTLRGKYALKNAGNFLPVHSHTAHTRSFDIFFTDGDTLMDGEVQAAAQSGGNADVTDADIAATTDLKLWIDMREDTLLSSAYANSPNIGDPVRYIYANSAAPSNIFSGYADFDVTAFGQGRGLSSQASWNYQVENAGSNWLASDEFTCVVAMKMPINAVTGFNRLLNFWWLEIQIRQGLVTITDAAGNYVDSGTGSIIPTKDYLITVQRKDPDGNGVFEMFTRLERLDTNAIVDPNSGTASGKPPGQQQAMWISHPSEHFLDKSGVLGPLILFLGVDATETTNAESWIRSQYDGENTSSSSGAATSASEDATFFVGLQVKQRNP